MSTFSGTLKKEAHLHKPPSTSQWSSVTGRSFVVRFVSQQSRKSTMFQDKGLREALLKRDDTKVIETTRLC